MVITTCLSDFKTVYTKGDRLGALSLLFPSPDFSLDLLGEAPEINLAYALCHGTLQDVLRLIQQLPNDEHVTQFLQEDLQGLRPHQDPTTPFGEQLCKLRKYESNTFLISLQEEQEMLDAVKEKESLKALIRFTRNFISFQYFSPNCYTALSQPQKPLFPLSYPPVPIPNLPSSPVALFVNAYDIDWDSLLKTLEEQPTLFIFNQLTIFIQSLQFTSLLKSLCAPNHAFLVLGQDIQTQMYVQRGFPFTTKTFEPVYLNTNEYFPLHDEILNSLHCPQGVNHLGKIVAFNTLSKQLGTRRTPALIRAFQNRDRFYIPSFVPKKYVSHKHEGDSRLQNYIFDRHNPIGPKRSLKESKIYNVAHIVPQIIDAPGHAPSQLLYTLLKYHNRHQFKHWIFTTEFFLSRTAEYPFNLPLESMTADAPLSSTRVQSMLGLLELWGVTCNFDEGTDDYAITAQRIAHKLSQHDIDFAIFHETDPINLLTALNCDVPCTLLLEHGCVSPIPVFDGIIFNHENEISIHAPLFAPYKTKLFANQLMTTFIEKSPPVQELPITFPKNALLMTTVSNRLFSRLSREMCAAIEEILKRVPNAYYAPIGQPLPKSAISRDPNIQKRIHFLGTQADVFPLLSHMDLYLNDFPVGGGVSLIEALAAGLPIVSFYDKDGGIPARHAGHFFGNDKTMRSLNVDDYINLACNLLKDNTLRSKWSEIALNRFEQMGPPSAYARRFEDVLNTYVS